MFKKNLLIKNTKKFLSFPFFILELKGQLNSVGIYLFIENHY